MLGKWFKGKAVPNNDGKRPENLEKLHYKKVFELELTNMEDSPVYSLTHQLSIGSEIGNIIISDPSISPRHATFVLQDEVVSIMDHGSVSGTTINGKKIAPGKYIILEETDVVNVGDLEVRMKVGRVAVKEEEIPEVPSEEEPEEVVEVSDEGEQEEAPVVPEVKEQKPAYTPPKRTTEEKPKNKVFAITPSIHSTNALIRVMAVASDLVLSYVILTIFMPFDEFREGLEFVSTTIASTIQFSWDDLSALAGMDLRFLKSLLTEGYETVSATFQIVPLILVFFFSRVLSTLLFGVSVSELFLGVRYSGNALWARIGGVLRVALGMITWPFLIFDIPSLFSKRTLKELITFTNTQVPSKFVAILGIIFFIPGMILLTLLAPLAQGLEFPEAIAVNDKIDQRVKVKVAEGEEVAEPVSSHDASRTLHLDVKYSGADLTIIPEFRFQGIQNKLTLKSSLVFYQRDLQRTVQFEILKTFSLKQLLSIGMRGNVFLYEKYPAIYDFVYAPEEMKNTSLPQQDKKTQLKFTNEVIEFIKSAFSLSPESVIDYVQAETPLLNSIVDFRSSFFELIEYKDFSQIDFVKMGNTTFMRISYDKQKPFDLLLPLLPEKGRIYKVTFDGKEDLTSVSSKFYKFNLADSDWTAETKDEKREVLSALGVFDLFSGDDFKTLLQSPERAQALYAYYYETSAALLKRDDSEELKIWKASVSNMLSLLEKLPVGEVEETETEVRGKLLQNFRDTVDALEHHNTEYFGVKQTTSV